MSDERRTWGAGDPLPRGVHAVTDRLGLTWCRHGRSWLIEGSKTHAVTWNSLVNNRGPVSAAVAQDEGQ